jgi:hypothetical protein
MIAILLLTLGQAHAAPPISKGATVLTGVGATFDGDPATLRLQVQGELPIEASDEVGLGVVLGLEGTTSGDQSFGVSTTNTMFTFLPMLRVRALNATPVRFYADGGVGLAQNLAASEGWFLSSSDVRTGWTTRFDVGLELGAPEGGVAFVAEPIGIDTLHFGDHHAVGYTARIGVGLRD